jgi:predicted transcriptional regulator
MKGQKTDIAVKEQIKHLMASGKTQSETARLVGVADSTVYNYMNKLLSTEEGRNEFEKLKNEKKEKMKEQVEKEFSKSMKETFENLFRKSANVITRAIDEDKLSPRDAITILGTTFDKRQILTGGKTANVGLSFEDVLKEINKGNEY